MRIFYRNIPFTAAVWLVARLLLAYEWLPAGWEKVFGPGSTVWVGEQAGAAVTGFLNRALTLATGDHPSVSQWYAWMIENVFLPNAVILSYMVAIGEVLVGIALLIGIFTRFATSMAILMNMAFFYAGTVSTLPFVLPLQLAMLFLGYYAGYYGVDGLILARISNWFRPPGEHERAWGAARVWELIIPAVTVLWVIILLIAIVGG